MEHSHLYDFNDCGAQYVNVFTKTLSDVTTVSELKKQYEYQKLQLRIETSRLNNLLKRVKNKIT